MKKKWISAALSLTLASTTITTMMPAYTVHAEKETTQGTTYYVSSSKGDDSNDGTSESKPFKTLEKINKLTLKPGIRFSWKKVLFLTIRSSPKRKRKCRSTY